MRTILASAGTLIAQYPPPGHYVRLKRTQKLRLSRRNRGRLRTGAEGVDETVYLKGVGVDLTSLCGTCGALGHSHHLLQASVHFYRAPTERRSRPDYA